MNLKTLMSAPLRRTIVVAVTTALISAVFTIFIIYLNRVANIDPVGKVDLHTYFAATNIPLGLLHNLLIDLAEIAKYAFELSTLLFISQIIYRLFKKRSKTIQ